MWFALVMRDPASLLEMLGTTVMHLSVKYGWKSSKLLEYKQRALRCVSERLQDPVLGVSAGVVATILSFLDYNVSLKSPFWILGGCVILFCSGADTGLAYRWDCREIQTPQGRGVQYHKTQRWNRDSGRRCCGAADDSLVCDLLDHLFQNGVLLFIS